MSDLRRIKVGYKVWIVAAGAMNQSQCHEATVRKVGRKWAYAGSYKLELTTGKSDWLEGRRVVAYRSREEWLEARRLEENWKAVKNSLYHIGNRSEQVTPEFVAALQAVVDQYYPEDRT